VILKRKRETEFLAVRPLDWFDVGPAGPSSRIESGGSVRIWGVKELLVMEGICSAEMDHQMDRSLKEKN
jgi:hypothetical protein